MIIELNQLVNTKQTTFQIRSPYYVICLKFQLRQDIAFGLDSDYVLSRKSMPRVC